MSNVKNWIVGLAGIYNIFPIRTIGGVGKLPSRNVSSQYFEREKVSADV